MHSVLLEIVEFLSDYEWGDQAKAGVFEQLIPELYQLIRWESSRVCQIVSKVTTGSEIQLSFDTYTDLDVSVEKYYSSALLVVRSYNRDQLGEQ